MRNSKTDPNALSLVAGHIFKPLTFKPSNRIVVRASSLHTSTVRDVQPRWPHHNWAQPIRRANQHDGFVVRASSLTFDRRDVQPRWPHHNWSTANTKGESARTNLWCGLPACTFHRRDVQPRWPHHNWAQPIRRANQHDGFVVRASSLHISTLRPTEIFNLQFSICNFQSAIWIFNLQPEPLMSLQG